MSRGFKFRKETSLGVKCRYFIAFLAMYKYRNTRTKKKCVENSRYPSYCDLLQCWFHEERPKLGTRRTENGF